MTETLTAWSVIADDPEGTHALALDRGFRVRGGRVVWENVRLPVIDRDDRGDDVVILQRLVPTERGIRTVERRVPFDTVIEIVAVRS